MIIIYYNKIKYYNAYILLYFIILIDYGLKMCAIYNLNE